LREEAVALRPPLVRHLVVGVGFVPRLECRGVLADFLHDLFHVTFGTGFHPHLPEGIKGFPLP
jgi:hypothetical protein